MSEATAVDGSLRWRLEDIYPTTEAWSAELSEIERGIEALAGFEDRLTDDAETLREGLDLYHDTLKRLYAASSYASMRYHEDMRVGETAEMEARANLLATRLSEAASFIEPAILAADRSRRSSAGWPTSRAWRDYAPHPRRHPPPGRSIPVGREEEAIIAAVGPAQRRGRERLCDVRQRRRAVADRRAVRRHRGTARPVGLREAPGVREPGRSPARVRAVLRRLDLLCPDLRRDPVRPGQEGHVLREGAALPELPRPGARREPYSGRGLSPARSTSARGTCPCSIATSTSAAACSGSTNCATTTSIRRWSRRTSQYTIDEARRLVAESAAPLGGDYVDVLHARPRVAVDGRRAAARQALRRLHERARLRRAPLRADELPGRRTTPSRPWPTSGATRCTRTWRTGPSRSRTPTIRSSRPRSRRPSTKRC